MVEVVYKPSEKISPIYAGGTITPPKFMPSYYEWLFFKGQQIIKHQHLSGAFNISVYVVPANYVFYLTGITFSATDYASLGADKYFSKLTLRDVVLMRIDLIPKSQGLIASPIFNIPIEVRAGDEFKLDQESSAIATNVTLFGFLVKIDDIPVF